MSATHSEFNRSFSIALHALGSAHPAAIFQHSGLAEDDQGVEELRQALISFALDAEASDWFGHRG